MADEIQQGLLKISLGFGLTKQDIKGISLGL